ncbi:RICIN domain-containing protein [Solwaraspora sp. WMMB762]|uniref:RICIN domain-containing protein n=1 Tax=Solwaraspora sp. WMMB762 TaxID=3404120 RepID=UPI003B942AE5
MSTFPAPPACLLPATPRPRHAPFRRRQASLIAVGLTVGVLLAGGAIAAAPPAASAATVDTTAWYVLVARHSGKVLDVRDSSTADGADVVQWSDVDRASQQ